jgi:SAM-dependent methyltransferase
MFNEAKPRTYYGGCNEHLLSAIPMAAKRILEVGCGEGYLGARLKERNPDCKVFGLEREPAVASRAAERLDQVFMRDVESEDPPLAPETVDCILYGDVLEHLVAPDAVLARHRRLLSPQGVVLCSVPNVQHHSLLAALLSGDFQYTAAGLLDATHLRFFSYSTFFKLLLDAGYSPTIADAIRVPCPPGLVEAAAPLLHYLGLHPGRVAQYLNVYQHIFRGTLLPVENRPEAAESAERERPLTFVACVPNEASLQANLLASPCLAEGSPHELVLMRGCANAAEGLNRGLERARHPVVVCLHQDVYLPRGWVARFWRQYEQAQRVYGNLGVVGVYGVSLRGGSAVPDGPCGGPGACAVRGWAVAGRGRYAG